MADAVVRITVDGMNYDLDMGDINAIDAKDFRREVGITLASSMTDSVDVDLDVIAGLVWLARRKTERGLTYNDVASMLSFNSDIDFSDVEDGEHPEA